MLLSEPMEPAGSGVGLTACAMYCDLQVDPIVISAPKRLPTLRRPNSSQHFPASAIAERQEICFGSPGPATYSPDDRFQAHHTWFPRATIGRGPGHKNLHNSTLSPGPAAFSTDDRQLQMTGWHRRAKTATIGHGPGHRMAADMVVSPGPGSYTPDDRHLAAHRHFPNATIGSGLGHVSWSHSDSPGPASYNLGESTVQADSRRKRSKSAPFGQAARNPASAEERLQFKRADRNGDGKLDFREVKFIMQQRFADTEDAEVQALFKAADRNHDSSIDFDEMVDFTHSGNPACRYTRDKMKVALAASAPSLSLGSSCTSSRSAQPNSGRASQLSLRPKSTTKCAARRPSSVGAVVALPCVNQVR